MSAAETGRPNIMKTMHHDGRTYAEAKSESAKWFRNKLEKQITEGRTSAKETVERVLSQVPQDALAKGRGLRFSSNGQFVMASGEHVWRLHNHAVGQVAQRAGVPANYVRKLQDGESGEWEPELLAHIMNTTYGHDPEDKKYLVRAVPKVIDVTTPGAPVFGEDGEPTHFSEEDDHDTTTVLEARGFLSDRYRRLDSRPLIDAFLQEATEMGAVVLNGTATDLRVALKVVMPMVFEPFADEIVAFGLEFKNSDFGKGKLAVSMIMDRLQCTNLWSLQDVLSQVHLGHKLADDIAFSTKTYELDTETQVSALRDLTKAFLAPGKINGMLEAINRAHTEECNWDQARKRLTNVLTKGELEKVKDKFESKDVELLPEGKTTYRLSNAISWLATEVDSDEKRLDLERLAGQVMDKHAAHLIEDKAA